MREGLNCKGVTAYPLLLVLFSAASKAFHEDLPYIICPAEAHTNVCLRDCSDQLNSAVCSSNWKTFDNKCEFEKSKCQRNANWTILYNEPCVTLPPPPADPCRQHQNRFYNLKIIEYDQMCNISNIMGKADNSTLELSDLIECYDPRCMEMGTEYSKFQCSYNMPNWCWCSDKKGVAIEGTLEKSLGSERCYNRSVCNYNGREYRDTQLFLPPDQCGLCECLDSTVECWTGYSPNTENKLNISQILQFVYEVTQLFNFQYSHRDQTNIDIRLIRQYPSIISDSRKTEVLQWKFDYYNRDNNDVLTASEQFLFRREIDSFLYCISFFDQIIELMDANCDSQVTQLEWSQFFTNIIDITVSCNQRSERKFPN